jgi:hypothetical protein
MNRKLLKECPWKRDLKYVRCTASSGVGSRIAAPCAIRLQDTPDTYVSFDKNRILIELKGGGNYGYWVSLDFRLS